MKTNLINLKMKKYSKKKLIRSRLLIAGLLYLSSQSLFALTFALPQDGGDIIGEIQMTTVGRNESLGEIGRRFDVGVYEMIEANPGVDPWVPKPGTVVVVPTRFILPSGPRQGLVLNLAEMRIYYYDPNKPIVTTYPVGIGRKNWSTPVANTTIISKKKDPSWVPPDSIRAEHRAKGDILPAVVPPGPENPMGRFALYLGIGMYRIHGTNKPGGIGVRGTHGCIRLFPEDIQALYYMVPVGTPVRFIHEPYKVGWHRNRLYLEAHQPLTDGRFSGSNSIDNLKRSIERAITGSHNVNWTSAQMEAKSQKGYPVRID